MNILPLFILAGVCFDTYDNDNRRNNPQVFVLENFSEEGPQWDHNTDYVRTMVTRSPGQPGSDSDFLVQEGLETASKKKGMRVGWDD